MPVNKATCTYLVGHPFDKTLKHVRKALWSAGISIRGELNVSARMRHALVVNMPPCVVLFASAASAEDTIADPWTASLTPMHVVVASRGAQTAVHIPAAVNWAENIPKRLAFSQLRRLQSDIAGAMAAIGMRSL